MFFSKITRKYTIIIASVVVTLSTITVFAGANEEKTKEVFEKDKKIKNVIMIVADGAGMPYYTAYRYFHDNPKEKGLDKTVFDPYFKGVQTTYSNTVGENITDSAAAATAMATGVKTYNSAVGVDVMKKPIKSVLEQAKENGMSTGIVVTSEINHATPAGFVAHNESRKNMNKIADDYYDEKINGKHKVDIMLGGGRKYFERTDRNITKQFQKDGYSVVKNKKELENNNNSKVIGLFSEKGLAPAIDRDSSTPSLLDMTKASIKQLTKNDKGFFLLIEASQIDWAAHDNDIVHAMSEMNEYADVFSYVMEYAKKDGQTQVIAAADHSSGGFTVGADGVYNWDASVIKATKRTPNYIAKKIAKGASVEKTLKKYFNVTLSTDEIKTIKNIVDETGREESAIYTAVDTAIENIINKHSHSGWTTTGHTGEEVPVYGYGKESYHLNGVIDNTDIAKMIFEILEENK